MRLSDADEQDAQEARDAAFGVWMRAMSWIVTCSQVSMPMASDAKPRSKASELAAAVGEPERQKPQNILQHIGTRAVATEADGAEEPVHGGKNVVPMRGTLDLGVSRQRGSDGRLGRPRNGDDAAAVAGHGLRAGTELGGVDVFWSTRARPCDSSSRVTRPRTRRGSRRSPRRRGTLRRASVATAPTSGGSAGGCRLLVVGRRDSGCIPGRKLS